MSPNVRATHLRTVADSFRTASTVAFALHFFFPVHFPETSVLEQEQELDGLDIHGNGSEREDEKTSVVGKPQSV